MWVDEIPSPVNRLSLLGIKEDEMEKLLDKSISQTDNAIDIAKQFADEVIRISAERDKLMLELIEHKKTIRELLDVLTAIVDSPSITLPVSGHGVTWTFLKNAIKEATKRITKTT